ncbi:MAG TPA: trehalose-phosphatase [Actinomycetota bacterium]|nr:trehalose-phosphatase [Actinomycetota bacterium]
MERLRGSPRAGLFFDFDGTLAEIVPRPQLAQPHPRAAAALARLVPRYALVAVVSGRPTEEVRRLLGVPGVEVVGLYGLGGRADRAALPAEVREAVAEAVAAVPGAWVEDKGPSLAVHFRGAPDPSVAERALRERLGDLAAARGLLLLPGKMVLELAPPDTPGKGAVVEEAARARGLTACLYAGDDLADLHAFAALDRLRARGLLTAKVAVRSPEAPDGLLEAADLTVEGQEGLAELLEELAGEP